MKLTINETNKYRNRYWVTDSDGIPLSNQPEEGYTKNQAILRAQREAEELSRLFKEPVSKTAKYFHIMNSSNNICYELDSAI